MNLEEIKSLIDIIQGTDITEIDLEEEDTKIRIKRGYHSPTLEDYSSVQMPVKTQDSREKEEKKQDDNTEEIVAPMVGTFYRAPAPDAEPYVEIGDIVNPGDVLCIIEAMKLMNEIEVETKGKIVDILVDNGQPVEYGQPLFVIEPL